MSEITESERQQIRNTDHVITADNLSFGYSKNEDSLLIKNQNFTIHRKGITAIIGESGSGKSTLLKLIYGLLNPISGQISYKGEPIPLSHEKLIPGHDNMKIVTQDFSMLNLYAKVRDNIASQLPNTNIEYKEKKTAEVLGLLKIDQLADKRTADVSGGEKQRTAIARALVHDPELLLMDEPFNQVDSAFRNELQSDIREIVDKTGLGIILVSHNPEEVLAISDDILIIKEGKVVESGKPKELYLTPKTGYSARLLAKSNILTSEEAKRLSIESPSSVIIHREWIEILKKTQKKRSSTFEIMDIFYRGFYYEVVLQHEELTLTALHYSDVDFEIGDFVKIQIRRHHPVEG